jgi:hypothetical protein
MKIIEKKDLQKLQLPKETPRLLKTLHRGLQAAVGELEAARQHGRAHNGATVATLGEALAGALSLLRLLVAEGCRRHGTAVLSELAATAMAALELAAEDAAGEGDGEGDGGGESRTPMQIPRHFDSMIEHLQRFLNNEQLTCCCCC